MDKHVFGSEDFRQEIDEFQSSEFNNYQPDSLNLVKIKAFSQFDAIERGKDGAMDCPVSKISLVDERIVDDETAHNLLIDLKSQSGFCKKDLRTHTLA